MINMKSYTGKCSLKVYLVCYAFSVMFYMTVLKLQVLGQPRWSQQKWSVESVHSKNVISILHLLVALARHYRAPIRLPENVAVAVVVVQVIYSMRDVFERDMRDVCD